MILNQEYLRETTLMRNSFLKEKTECYYVLDYLRYGVPGNPDFILTLKNTFNDKSITDLLAAKETARDILCRWVPDVMEEAGLSSCMMACVPRAKALETYTPTQLYLLDAVSEAAGMLANVTDGIEAIVRHTNTKTTHLRNSTVTRVTANGTREANMGAEPYPGITKDTCWLDTEAVFGENILLVDDIYTAGVNIDEDCIQALYDAGAERVVLFALSRTV